MPNRQTSSTQPVCPASLQRWARKRLAKTGYPLLQTIDCSVERGALTLRGRVPSFYHKQVAQTAVAAGQHAARVVNHLEVSP